MNKSNIKTPFAVRTIIVMIVIFLAVSGSATYITAQNYMDSMIERADRQLEAIKEDINECKDINKESVEYRGHINVAQAYAVMRHYRFVTLKDFRDVNATADAGLYRIETDSEGIETGICEVLPQSTVIYGAPHSTRGTIIVLEDSYSPQQVKQIETIIKNGSMDGFLENVTGYKAGRFMYPTELPLNDNITVKTEQTSHSGKLMSVDMYDTQVVLSDGTVTGGHQNERLEPYSFRRECEQGMQYNLESGEQVRGNYSMMHQENRLEEVTLEHTASIPGTDYIVKLYVQIHPLMYAMKNLIDFYLALLLILFIMGTVLVNWYNRVIERRLETEAKRRHMMDSMAHEMKTPLSVIKSFGEVLLEETDEPRRDYYTKAIIDEANDMNQVIISMLDFSKMEAGTYPMELSDVPVSELAAKHLTHTEILMQKKNLQLEADIQDTPQILADAKLINNIISNFLSNGIHHAVTGGMLKLTVKSEGDEIYIACYNQGARISEDDMKKLWESFYRNRKTNEDSSGLGLAIVRNASLMHNGSYGCYNEEDGVTFWAKVKSMEDEIQMAEATTGPVIGVTSETYELKGLLVCTAGALLQLIFLCPQMITAFAQIALPSTEATPVWEAAGRFIMLVGANLVIDGSYRLLEKNLWSRKHFALSGLILLFAAVFFTFVRDIDSSGEAFAISGLVFVWFAALVVMILELFRTCIKLESEIGIPLKQLDLKRRRILFISAIILWLVSMAIIWIDSSIGNLQIAAFFAAQIGRYAIPAALLMTFYKVWKQYNGKSKD